VVLLGNLGEQDFPLRVQRHFLLAVK
jgi:hypothetical protein